MGASPVLARTVLVLCVSKKKDIPGSLAAAVAVLAASALDQCYDMVLSEAFKLDVDAVHHAGRGW